MIFLRGGAVCWFHTKALVFCNRNRFWGYAAGLLVAKDWMPDNQDSENDFSFEDSTTLLVCQ
jgi:hypothetical protein